YEESRDTLGTQYLVLPTTVAKLPFRFSALGLIHVSTTLFLRVVCVCAAHGCPRSRRRLPAHVDARRLRTLRAARAEREKSRHDARRDSFRGRAPRDVVRGRP